MDVRQALLGGVSALALACAAGSARAACTLPYTLLPNTLADATKVMADLTALASCVTSLVPASKTNYYYAKDYGDFGSSSDVGLAINAALAACAVPVLGGNTGGYVVVPAGTYNFATQIASSVSGCKLKGAGYGVPRDTVDPSIFIASTRLVWNGTAAATAVLVSPAGTQSLYDAGIEDLVVDCNAVCNVAVKIVQVTYSKLHFGVAEARSIGAWLTTNTGTDAPGTQNNDIDIRWRGTTTSDAYHPTGIMLDGAAGSSWNASLNQQCKLYAWYNSGDGIVFGNSDNNHCDVATFPQPAVLSGRPVVVANANYASPNGVSVNGTARNTRLGQVNTPVYVLGLQTGSTLTEGAGNTGTAHYHPVTLTTNSTTGQTSFTLNFAATATIAVGQSIDCGAGSSQPRNTIAAAKTGTTVTMQSEAQGAIASGVACVFGWGFTADARPGNYVITSTDGGGGHYSITAPAGGHSQTGVSVSGGVLAFEDVVFPISGAPVLNDTWTLGAPSPSLTTSVEYIDQDNSTPLPAIEPVATIGTIVTSSGQIGVNHNPTYQLDVSPYANVGNIAVGCQLSGCRQYRWQADTNGLLALIDQTGTVVRSTITGTGIQQWFGAFASQFYGETHTSDFVISAADSGKHYNNTAAGGTVNGTLPLAVGGLHYCFAVTAAQTLRVIANAADTIAIGGTVGAAGGSAAANAVYASVCLESPLAGRWIAVSTPDKSQWTVL